MSAIRRYYTVLLNKPLVVWFFVLLLGSYLVTIITAPVPFLFGNGFNESFKEPGATTFKAAFFVVIAAPLLETFINQYCIYEYLIRSGYFRKRPSAIIFLSGLTFGLLHYYSIPYMVWAFIFGSYLCFCYHFFRSAGRKAFWFTFLIHSTRNLTALLLILNS